MSRLKAIYLLIFLSCVLFLCACKNINEQPATNDDKVDEAKILKEANTPKISFIVLDEEIVEEDLKDRVEEKVDKLAKVLSFSDIVIGIGRDIGRQYSENIITFTLEEICSAEFEDRLILKVTDLPYWKRVGLKEYIYGYEPSFSETEVIEYIASAETSYFGSMFSLYFFEDFSDKMTCKMAKDYAYYVTKYALERYSYEKFDQRDYREEWMTEAGIDYALRCDDIDFLIQKSEVSKAKGHYIIACGANTWEIGDVEWLKTADQVYEMLYKSEEAIIDFSKAVAAESNEYDEKDFRKSVRIIASGENRSSEALNYQIVLTQPSSFLHEYVHCVLNYSASEAWLIEGIAERYALLYECSFYEWDEYYQRVFDNGILTEDEEKEYEENGFLEYVKSSIANYQKIRTQFGNDTNQIYCMKIAMGISDLMYFGTEIAKNVAVPSVQDADRIVIHNERLGNQLSYVASMIIASSIIDEFGVDRIINSSKSFEKDFGITSDEYILNYLDDEKYMVMIGESDNEDY